LEPFREYLTARFVDDAHVDGTVLYREVGVAGRLRPVRGADARGLLVGRSGLVWWRVTEHVAGACERDAVRVRSMHQSAADLCAGPTAGLLVCGGADWRTAGAVPAADGRTGTAQNSRAGQLSA
jgi:hypothetical protein